MRTRRALARHLSLLAPLLIALCGCAASLQALHALTFAPAGRDQGIFHYVAWALRHGARGYRDFHEINGPLPHAYNVLVQAVMGEDEHAFRRLDTAVMLAAYAAAGAVSPTFLGLACSRGQRVAWALAAVTVLGAQYASFDYWDTAQRESFYSVLLYGSLASQALAHDARAPRRAALLFAVSGALSALTWFGKPPCVIFAGFQAGVVYYDRRSLALAPGRALAAGLGGAAVATMAIVAFTVSYEDPFSAIRQLSAVTLLHHTIWNKSILDCYTAYGNAARLNLAGVSVLAFVALHVLRGFPRRSLLVLILPVGGFVVFAAQGKGFPYHLHMVTLGSGVIELVLIAALAAWASRSGTWSDFVTVAAVALGLVARESALDSPGIVRSWATLGATPELRASTSYLEAFAGRDFFLVDLHAAAEHIREHTRADETVQMYGLDPYLLFLTRRHTATPVIYDFEVNVDAAVEAGSGSALSASERSVLAARAENTRRLMLDRLKDAPPAAFVFVDRAPFTYPEDSEADFARHCGAVYDWLGPLYEPALRFGKVRVRMRSHREGDSDR